MHLWLSQPNNIYLFQFYYNAAVAIFTVAALILPLRFFSVRYSTAVKYLFIINRTNIYITLITQLIIVNLKCKYHITTNPIWSLMSLIQTPYRPASIMRTHGKIVHWNQSIRALNVRRTCNSGKFANLFNSFSIFLLFPIVLKMTDAGNISTAPAHVQDNFWGFRIWPIVYDMILIGLSMCPFHTNT